MRGSHNLQRYLRARDHGHSRADAAAYAEIPVGEAELVDREREAAPIQKETENV